MSSPCYQCEERQVNCHASCEKYIAYKDGNIARSRERYPNCIYRNYARNKYNRYMNMVRRGEKE